MRAPRQSESSRTSKGSQLPWYLPETSCHTASPNVASPWTRATTTAIVSVADVCACTGASGCWEKLTFLNVGSYNLVINILTEKIEFKRPCLRRWNARYLPELYSSSSARMLPIRWFSFSFCPASPPPGWWWRLLVLLLFIRLLFICDDWDIYSSCSPQFICVFYLWLCTLVFLLLYLSLDFARCCLLYLVVYLNKKWSAYDEVMSDCLRIPYFTNVIKRMIITLNG